MAPGHYSQSCEIVQKFPDKYAQNDDCMNHIHRQYTHTFTNTHIFAQISYKRHFFRCSANKEIWLLATISRAVKLYMNFLINMPRTMTA